MGSQDKTPLQIVQENADVHQLVENLNNWFNRVVDNTMTVIFPSLWTERVDHLGSALMNLLEKMSPDNESKSKTLRKQTESKKIQSFIDGIRRFRLQSTFSVPDIESRRNPLRFFLTLNQVGKYANQFLSPSYVGLSTAQEQKLEQLEAKHMPLSFASELNSSLSQFRKFETDLSNEFSSDTEKLSDWREKCNHFEKSIYKLKPNIENLNLVRERN